MIFRTRATGDSSRHRRRCVTCAVLSATIALLVTPVISTAELPPVDWSGNVGYTYRSLTTGEDETISNQFLGTLNGHTYLWRPWFAQLGARLTGTMDSTEYGGSGSGGSDSEILTGEIDLNVLPQSSTPFTM